MPLCSDSTAGILGTAAHRQYTRFLLKFKSIKSIGMRMVKLRFEKLLIVNTRLERRMKKCTKYPPQYVSARTNVMPECGTQWEFQWERIYILWKASHQYFGKLPLPPRLFLSLFHAVCGARVIVCHKLRQTIVVNCSAGKFDLILVCPKEIEKSLESCRRLVPKI